MNLHRGGRLPSLSVIAASLPRFSSKLKPEGLAARMPRSLARRDACRHGSLSPRRGGEGGAVIFRALGWLQILALMAIFPLLIVQASAQSATNAASIRFETVDIFVDPQDKPLAAYQLEFSVTNGLAKIVGIEGGEHTAFREPPFYDPKAMQSERVIIAAFSTAKELPAGKTRVATIHIQISSTVEPQISTGQQLTADFNGNELSAKISFEMRAKK
jgi:hypothetical protein